MPHGNVRSAGIQRYILSWLGRSSLQGPDRPQSHCVVRLTEAGQRLSHPVELGLATYQFSVQHHNGQANANTDALSQASN